MPADMMPRAGVEERENWGEADQNKQIDSHKETAKSLHEHVTESSGSWDHETT